MLKKLLIYNCLLLLLVFNSSCFDILEEINLKKDGSGSLLITMNMSKSKTKLASIMLLDSVNGHKVPSEHDIALGMNDIVSHLKKTKGITNIKQTKDFKNYIFSVSCDFADIKSLNAISSEMIKEQNKRGKTNFSTNNFAYNATEKVFERKFTYDPSIKKSFDYLDSENKKIFDDASYTSIYRFEESIEKSSNRTAKIAPSKKAIMLRVNAMAFIQGKASIQNKIKLSN